MLKRYTDSNSLGEQKYICLLTLRKGFKKREREKGMVFFRLDYWDKALPLGKCCVHLKCKWTSTSIHSEPSQPPLCEIKWVFILRSCSANSRWFLLHTLTVVLLQILSGFLPILCGAARASSVGWAHSYLLKSHTSILSVKENLLAPSSEGTEQGAVCRGWEGRQRWCFTEGQVV